jgi:hypothetical protein
MKTNPLLEELWQVKDDLAREAGYDIDRIFAELRAAAARPLTHNPMSPLAACGHPRPSVISGHELSDR